MNKEECKRQHLDHVQGVITRMAGNSFQIKGFCMAMATILGALYAANFRCELMIVLALISVACALVDAYYLRQEKKYCELYKRSVAKMEEDRPYKEIYDMDVRKIKMNYWRCLFSKSLWMPYGIILALLLIWLFLSCLHLYWKIHDNLILYGIITSPLLTYKRLIMNRMSLLYLH